MNTSCVDGSVVFIDPISFSVLKKVQFRYSDFELNKRVKQAIKKLKQALLEMQEKSGKSLLEIFSELMDRKT